MLNQYVCVIIHCYSFFRSRTPTILWSLWSSYFIFISVHSCRVRVSVPNPHQAEASLVHPHSLKFLSMNHSFGEFTDCNYSNFKIKNFVQLTSCPSFMPAMFQTNVVLASLYGTPGIHTGPTLRWNTASKVYCKQICADIVFPFFFLNWSYLQN